MLGSSEISERSAITWLGKKEKGKQSEVNIHLGWSCAVHSPRRARIHSQVRLLECAALTSSACGGTAERSKSQQRGFPSCHNLTVFRCLSVFSWHQQRAARVFLSGMFLTGLQAQYLTISSGLYLQRSPCPQHFQF